MKPIIDLCNKIISNISVELICINEYNPYPNCIAYELHDWFYASFPMKNYSFTLVKYLLIAKSITDAFAGECFPNEKW